MIAELKCPECLSGIDYDIRRKKIKDEFIEEDLINCPSCGYLLEVTADVRITVVRDLSMEKKYETIKEIVEQLEWCSYECQGGSLEMNTAFIALKDLSEKEKRSNDETKIDRVIELLEKLIEIADRSELVLYRIANK